MTDRDKPPDDAAAEQQKRAGRRLEWPTLFHRDQIPFPWDGARRLRRRRSGASDEPLKREEPEKA